MSSTHAYVGRFAPSPSGPLHLGSLVTALGSFLQARALSGQWRLRIDDIDPPRIMPGAMQSIQTTLLAHGLQWDGPVVLQSQQVDSYAQMLTQLDSADLLYPCSCTRAQVKAKGSFYTGTCRQRTEHQGACSLRFKNQSPIVQIDDNRLGKVAVNPAATGEDFIVKRKDGLYAYHLASVADDIALGITEIVRGEDLLEATACQWSLFKALSAPLPACMHLPLVTFDDGRKFSKQNHAPALDIAHCQGNLIDALSLLGLSPPQHLLGGSVQQIIDWGIGNWPLSRQSQADR